MLTWVRVIYILQELSPTLPINAAALTGEIVVGPCKTLFMDEISTGLDSSTTYQIVSCIRNMVRMRNVRPLLCRRCCLKHMQCTLCTPLCQDKVMLRREGPACTAIFRASVMCFSMLRVIL